MDHVGGVEDGLRLAPVLVHDGDDEASSSSSESSEPNLLWHHYSSLNAICRQADGGRPAGAEATIQDDDATADARPGHSPMPVAGLGTAPQAMAIAKRGRSMLSELSSPMLSNTPLGSSPQDPGGHVAAPLGASWGSWERQLGGSWERQLCASFDCVWDKVGSYDGLAARLPGSSPPPLVNPVFLGTWSEVALGGGSAGVVLGAVVDAAPLDGGSFPRSLVVGSWGEELHDGEESAGRLEGIGAHVGDSQRSGGLPTGEARGDKYLGMWQAGERSMKEGRYGRASQHVERGKHVVGSRRMAGGSSTDSGVATSSTDMAPGTAREQEDMGKVGGSRQDAEVRW